MVVPRLVISARTPCRQPNSAPPAPLASCPARSIPAPLLCPAPSRPTEPCMSIHSAAVAATEADVEAADAAARLPALAATVTAEAWVLPVRTGGERSLLGGIARDE